MFQATEGRWGSREVEITKVDLMGEDGEPSHVFHSGEKVTVRLHVAAKAPVADFVFGFGLFNAEGVCCYGTNTSIEQLVSEKLEGAGTVDLVIDRLDLTEGTYKLDVAVHKLDGYPVRLPPAPVHLPREVADEGRRGLPPAAHMVVLQGHPVASGGPVTAM